MKLQALLVSILILSMSCSSNVSKPEDLISEEKMVDIIYETSILNAAKGVNKRELENNGIFPEQFIYTKYDVDSLQFAASLNYYAASIETYDGLYLKVEERIKSEKDRIEILIKESEEVKRSTQQKKSRTAGNRTIDTSQIVRKKPKFDAIGIKIQETNKQFLDNEVLKLTRASTTAQAYLRMNMQTIAVGETIEATVYVKKNSENNALGFRVAGVYPNRVDAIFDLKNGILKDVKSTGYFENEVASIKIIDKEWYECKIKVKANINKVRIVLGPTDIDKSVKGWESKSQRLSYIYATEPFLIRE
nr:DUF4296 domain-containing protein [uncultured Psychroserpens sp.]